MAALLSVIFVSWCCLPSREEFLEARTVFHQDGVCVCEVPQLVDRYTPTRDFLDISDLVHASLCGSRCHSVCLTKSLMHMSSHVLAFFVSCFVSSSLSLAPLLSLTVHLFSDLLIKISMLSISLRNQTTAVTHNDEYCSVAIHNLSRSWQSCVNRRSD